MSQRTFGREYGFQTRAVHAGPPVRATMRDRTISRSRWGLLPGIENSFIIIKSYGTIIIRAYYYDRKRVDYTKNQDRYPAGRP
jgi:hypothetical protein